MSEPSEGGQPQGKGPTRRRRRRRRRNRHRSTLQPGGNGPEASAPAAQKGPPESDLSETGGSGVGSRNSIAFGDGETGGARHNGVPLQEPNNDRKNGHQIRNLRAVPVPASDVVFDPTRAKPRTKGRSRRNTQRSHRSRRLYAALDLGTNNCRLLIALPQEPGRFRVVDGFSRIVRLGEGMSQTGKLSEAAMERSIEALKVCATKLAQKQVYRARLIATEACRQADNGSLFLERVKNETGLELEVVDRETEARLAAEGCGMLMDRRSDGAVLFDIGGGSSELILVDSRSGRSKRRIADGIVAWTSLPLGVVTLAEKFGGTDVTRESFDAMVSHVDSHIELFEDRERLRDVWSGGNVHLLGTSGTVTTLAGIHLELPKYDRRKVDGLWLRDHQIDLVVERLLAMAYEERARNPCIGRERADLVMAGCAILEAIRRRWPSPRLRVADRGLREGLLAEMINRDNGWLRRRRSRFNAGKGRRELDGHSKKDQ